MIPSRGEWTAYFIFGNRVISVFMDVSETVNDFGVICHELVIYKSPTLPNTCTKYLVEICAVNEEATEIREFSFCISTVDIKSLGIELEF